MPACMRLCVYERLCVLCVSVCVPTHSLYHSLKDVYSPLLGVSAAGAGRKGQAAGALSVTPQLTELLMQVQAGLGAAVRKGMVSAMMPAE